MEGRNFLRAANTAVATPVQSSSRPQKKSFINENRLSFEDKRSLSQEYEIKYDAPINESNNRSLSVEGTHKSASTERDDTDTNITTVAKLGISS